MRLRYIHLPDYGVLKDLRVSFDRERIFRKHEDLRREGDLHFVVGLNGTGKSSLLRALFETFRWIEGVNGDQIDPRTPFPFPITLAYELPLSKKTGENRLCLFHHRGGSVSGGFFFASRIEKGDPEVEDWDSWIEAIWEFENASKESNEGIFVKADKFVGNNLITNSLPKQILVYTSGSLSIWNRVREPDLPEEDLVTLSDVGFDDERPRGWNVQRELASDFDLGEKQRDALRDFIAPSSASSESRCRLLEPEDLQLAAVAVGLTEAAADMPKLANKQSEAKWRDVLKERIEAQSKGEIEKDKSARTLLNYIDWWFPTHLSISYRPSAKMKPDQHAQLLVLCVLADQVIRQPLSQMQMVFNLGPRICRVEEAINEHYVDREIPVEVREIINRVEGATSGAQGVVRALCPIDPASYETSNPERARWEVFRNLSSWRSSRLMDDATFTIRRVTQMEASDGKLDDVVLTWEDLSDGEQMLLGRMSLLLLLSGLDGSLLLLDEPETHFNDSWKREIIDIVDDNILKKTQAQVVVSTHTSIALTDAFASEIIRLVRSNGKSKYKPVKVPTFGASPSRIMTHVFDMPASIGSRAEQALRASMVRQWTTGDVEELENLLANIGNGWPMAKLQKILDSLTNATPDS